MPVELAEADAKADTETFAIGDWYKLRVKRRGVSTQEEGKLVKLNDEWIVLRVVREGRTEYGVPVVSKLPFVGKRLFRNVGIGRTDENIWIPRDAATVVERTIAGQPSPDAERVVPASRLDDGEKEGVRTAAGIAPAPHAPAGEEPPTGRACSLELAGAKEPEQADGDVIAVTDDAISLMVTREVAVSEQVPLVGGLPFVGRAFTRTRVEHRKERRLIDRADILCVRVSNHEPVAAYVELTPTPEDSDAPIAPSPPMPK